MSRKIYTMCPKCKHNLHKDDFPLSYGYCPFCGRKLEDFLLKRPGGFIRLEDDANVAIPEQGGK